MTNKRSFGGLLHWATHRIPGVPAHAERSAGHQGAAVHGRARRPGGVAAHASLNRRWNHSPARPPRFMRAFQRRIAAFFSREL
ncbi:hypothetical protein GA0070624_3767 [Micromonospora rhizosphaerae]|uniref:Uncharacterized protein n=1 Tax=Micromonospora rhizosphaerae TaxID=568872 RepID=A0A1C6SHC1_9ACTN|nr:hypothetical protein [Micromonospora rhizosphaerae]SCL28825.1 hypothetical protein GA0070624_3767 [Micromonospora rhizosphaerae]